MKKRRYICKNCGHEFEREAFEDIREAKEKNIQPIPIRCPECGSTSLKRV